jgi:hypothetical protein
MSALDLRFPDVKVDGSIAARGRDHETLHRDFRAAAEDMASPDCRF